MGPLGYHRKRLRDLAAAVGAGRALAERERWPRERLERYQHERLEALVRYARERSPFWAARLPRGRVSLERLPSMDKAEMVAGVDELLTDRRLRRDELLAHLERIDRDELLLGEFRVMATSGSSGRPGLFVYDRQAWIGILSQFVRYSAWVGIRPRLPRTRIASVGGAAPSHMTRRVAASIDVGLHRATALPVTAPLPRLVEQLNAIRPQILNAYPSMAALLAEEQLAGRLRLELGAMSTSSEPLLPADGRAVPAGEPGARLLITNLFNRTQPLIRFEIGDLVTVDPDPCACGRTLMRLRGLEGRSEDVIQLGGVAIHPMQFALLNSDPDVREFQVVHGAERLRLRVALRAGANGAAARLRVALAERLREAGVAQPAIDVEVVERLERTAAGKLPLVVTDQGTRP